MSTDASLEDRMGEHVVMTITEPAFWLVLQTYPKQVRVQLLTLAEFAATYSGDFRDYMHNRFTFEQERALIRLGYAAVGGGGRLIPTLQLVNDLLDWQDRHR